MSHEFVPLVPHHCHRSAWLTAACVTVLIFTTLAVVLLS